MITISIGFCFFSNSSVAVNDTGSTFCTNTKNYIFFCGKKRSKKIEDKETLSSQKGVTKKTQTKKLLKTPKKCRDKKASAKYSPTSTERKFLSPFRRALVLEEYPSSSTKKGEVSSPKVRELFKKNFKKKSLREYYQRVRVNGKTVYQADFLYDPFAMVLSGGEWKTNHDCMVKGLSPIGHKGIASEEERETLSEKKITAKQQRFRIELHHVTQKDTGTNEDPLVEMTNQAHMGKNSRIILQYNDDSESMEIVHSSLEKEDALKLCEDNQYIITNVLHFRKGPSLIKREKFDSERKEHWKTRAAEFVKKKDKKSSKSVCKRLFH